MEKLFFKINMKYEIYFQKTKKTCPLNKNTKKHIRFFFSFFNTGKDSFENRQETKK